MLPSWLPDTTTTAPDRMVERALLWGLEGLELRTVGGPSDRVPHVNEARLRRRLEASDLAVCSVVPGLFESAVSDRAAWMNDLAVLDETLAFCGRFACQLVVVSSFGGAASDPDAADVLRRAGDRAARRGVRIGVVNETDRGCRTGADLVRMVTAVDHPSVGAVWDPAAAIPSGEDPSGIVRDLAGMALLVRYVEDAAVAWPDLLEGLAAGAFDGPVSLVLPQGAAPADGLEAATRLVHRLRKAGGQSTKPA